MERRACQTRSGPKGKSGGGRGGPAEEGNTGRRVLERSGRMIWRMIYRISESRVKVREDLTAQEFGIRKRRTVCTFVAGTAIFFYGSRDAISLNCASPDPPGIRPVSGHEGRGE